MSDPAGRRPPAHGLAADAPGTSDDLGPVGSLGSAAWRSLLGLAEGEAPAAVVVEGSWWRARRTAWRTGRLTDPRELAVPDIHLGRWQGAAVMYACCYGAPRAAEVVHMGALAGTRLVVQVGTCGIVAPGIRPGDVIVPRAAACLEGVAALYGAAGHASSAAHCSDLASERLAAGGQRVHRGRVVSWPGLFAQPTDIVRAWREQGYLGVDMETAATLAVAARFGVPAVAMLVAWDELLAGRTFLDPLPTREQAAFGAADAAVFEVALGLLAGLAA